MTRTAPLLIALALAACAHAPGDPGWQPSDYTRGYAAAWAKAKAIGRREALDELRARPVFKKKPIRICPDKVSWLPRTPNIDAETFWQSRKTDIQLLDQCRRISQNNASIARARRTAVMEAQ